mmetsp:Transcript_84840/g.230331  ORF Transcript_84840/g.230331 Transcript_84840/m.230331 type:complete len:198 (-) Transcript_84840:254-847(-)
MPCACAICGASFGGESKCKQFSMCGACYATAYDLDMSGRLRDLKFKAPDHIVDNIYLGGEAATLDRDWLLGHNIDRVLTLACHMHHLEHHSGIQYLQIDVDDDPSEALRPHLNAAFEFIRLNPATNVLVHCVSGISRSGATVVAYVMESKGLSYEASLELVRFKRPEVSPNSGFQEQLHAFEQELLRLKGVECSNER